MVKNEMNAGPLSPADTTNGSNGKNSTFAVENSNMISTATANDAVCNDEVVINKENRMQKNNTKSAGVSHPAAKMDNLGNNIINSNLLMDVKDIGEVKTQIKQMYAPFIEEVERKTRSLVEAHYPCLLRHWGKNVDELPKTVAHKYHYSNNAPMNTISEWLNIDVPNFTVELYDGENFYEQGDYDGLETCRVKINSIHDLSLIGCSRVYSIIDLWNIREQIERCVDVAVDWAVRDLEKNYEDYDFLHYCEMVCDLGEREIKGGSSQRMREAIAKWCVRFDQVKVCHPFVQTEHNLVWG